METILRVFSKTTDEILLSSTQKDVDEFFDKEKVFLLEYHSLLKDATLKADRMTKSHKGLLRCHLLMLSTLAHCLELSPQMLLIALSKYPPAFWKWRQQTQTSWNVLAQRLQKFLRRLG